MTDLWDDAISNFEMSFDREAELREENKRGVAEQADSSHSQDDYIYGNKGGYDAVGATASARIEEDEEQPSSSRSILKTFNHPNQSSRQSPQKVSGWSASTIWSKKSHPFLASYRQLLNSRAYQILIV